MAVIQFTFTHKQYTKRHKTNSTQYNTKILEECRPCPTFTGFTLEFALQLRKKHGNTAVRVADECHRLLSRTLFIAYSVIMGPQHVTNSRILNTIPVNFKTGKAVTTKKKNHSVFYLDSVRYFSNAQSKSRTQQNHITFYSSRTVEYNATTLANGLSL